MTRIRPAPVLPPRPVTRSAAVAWAGDRCPPAPLVRLDELCLPAGVVPDGARPVVGDLLVVAPRVTPGHRAAALALLLPHGHGVLVRATAAWVWTGEPSLRPARVDLAVPPGAPALPGPRPAPDQAGLPVRRTRWTTGSTWAQVAGVGVAAPATTAAECARRLPARTARACVEALVTEAGVDLDEVVGLLRRGGRGGGPAPPGTADALRLLASLAGDP